MPKEEKVQTALEQLEALEEAFTERLAQISVEASKTGGDGYTLPLYEPVMKGADKVTAIHFRAQTIGDIRATEGEIELAARLCGFEAVQLEQLSDIDWESVGAVLKGFKLRRAAGGPARKD